METIRHYQGLELLPVSASTEETRCFAPHLVDRIGLIKRAPGLGFAPSEIATLLDPADGRIRRAERTVTSARFDLSLAKLSDPSRMQRTLDELLAHCIATGEVHRCPIIEALMGNGTRREGALPG
jgi:DNA-binding transcriptional MerR regulator